MKKNILLSLMLLVITATPVFAKQQLSAKRKLTLEEVIKASPHDPCINLIPLLCQTSLTDLSVKQHTRIIAESLSISAVSALLLLGLIKVFSSQQPFTKNFWIDEKTNTPTIKGNSVSTSIAFVASSRVLALYEQAKPENLARAIDTDLLRKLNDVNELGNIVKSCGGRLQAGYKITMLNRHINQLIKQLKSIEKYNNNKIIQIIVERLEEQSAYISELLAIAQG